MRRIGLFGGSFNPIHNGHIGLAKHILDIAKLDEVWFMVSPLNPLKADNDDLLDDVKRLELTRMALENEPLLHASDFEFHLPKPSYTWQTLQSLSAEFRETEFHLIIGADNWQLFPRWYRADDIIRNYHIIVYPRRGFPVDTDTLPKTVHFVNTPLYPISSTEVRKCIRENRSVSHLIPHSIVRKAELYYKS